jgi:hypothetical protein
MAGIASGAGAIGLDATLTHLTAADLCKRQVVKIKSMGKIKPIEYQSNEHQRSPWSIQSLRAQAHWIAISWSCLWKQNPVCPASVRILLTSWIASVSVQMEPQCPQ